jgi:ubiquinol-cytochrome c reductase iron-sulfur subunit
VADSKTISDPARRAVLVRATTAVGCAALAGAAVPFVLSLKPSARATANAAPVDFDASRLQPGELATTQWRGRPVWILRRTDEQLRTLAKVAPELSDPKCKTPQQPSDMKLDLANGVRALDPHLLVLVGICTHLGCIPNYFPQPGALGGQWAGGFYCPCHGSKYDLSGRVFSGSPAPLNLPVPPYSVRAPGLVRIGETQSGGDQNWQPAIW